MTSTDVTLHARLDALCSEGRAFWRRFDATVRDHAFHPFVAADYDVVRGALLSLRAPGRRFLEWGSASGIITIMADLMGFEACGIEADAALVDAARATAARHGSRARFAQGSFLPAGYEWRSADGDPRTGTLAAAYPGYPQLGLEPREFDVVFGYPWDGEAPVMRDVMQRCGRGDALLLLYDVDGRVRSYRGGHEELPTVHARD
ncbi:MAG TPA: hypothetical protein VEA99_16260 [Gemmatimonadaceae bacterium]|nr:hypothetical protein [Gemmatimonadaceae bacterium]